MKKKLHHLKTKDHHKDQYHKEDFSEKILNEYYNKKKDHKKKQEENKIEFSLKPKDQKMETKVHSEKQMIKTFDPNKKQPIILSIGGGKGGIGKSFLTANIAVRLATLGYKVAAIDLDLGAANLHTCLGMPSPTKGVSDFFQGQIETLEETGVPSIVPNLTLYGGNQDFWQHVKPQGSQKIKLINHLQELDADYVFIDLGAGTHVHTLDFFIFSDAGLLVVVPEPTSIENAYVFMKSVMFRKIQNICRAFEISPEIENGLLERIVGLSTNTTPLNAFLEYVNHHPQIDKEIINIINATNIGIIMNQVRTQEDADLGLSMSTICQQYFGFSSQFLGAMRYDDSAWKSIRIRKPLILDYPHCAASSNIYHIVEELIRRYEALRKSQQYSQTS
jgi:flagellar biosynthesis protein FlhG